MNSANETIQGIREKLKSIKDAVTVIEFKLSQLESASQAPLRARSEQERQPAKRAPGIDQKPLFKLRVRRSNR